MAPSFGSTRPRSRGCSRHRRGFATLGSSHGFRGGRDSHRRGHLAAGTHVDVHHSGRSRPIPATSPALRSSGAMFSVGRSSRSVAPSPSFPGSTSRGCREGSRRNALSSQQWQGRGGPKTRTPSRDSLARARTPSAGSSTCRVAWSLGRWTLWASNSTRSQRSCGRSIRWTAVWARSRGASTRSSSRRRRQVAGHPLAPNHGAPVRRARPPHTSRSRASTILDAPTTLEWNTSVNRAKPGPRTSANTLSSIRLIAP